MKKEQVSFIFLTIIGRVIGLVREMALSYVYGASSFSDAYTVATTFSSIVFAGVAATLLNGFIPGAVEANKKNRLMNFTNSMFKETVMLSYGLSLVLFVFLRFILRFLTRGFSATAYTWSYELSEYVLVFAPILCIINIFVGYLQVKDYFLSLPIQSILTNCIMIVVFFASQSNINVMGWGYGLSVAFPLVVIIVQSCRRNFTFLLLKKDERERTIDTWLLILPTFGVQLAAQFNGIVDRSFASSLGEGTVSMMKYAYLICTMVVSVIAVPIGMMRYPKISEAISSNRLDDAKKIVYKTIKEMLIITIPIVIGMIVFANFGISIVFGRGAFTSENVYITSRILQIYAFSVLGNSLMEILSRVMLSAKKTKALLVIYCLFVFLNIMMNSILIKKWGEYGLALGTTISTTIAAFSIVVYIGKYILSVSKHDT